VNAPDRILIVDDDQEIRTLLVDYLAKNGFAAEAVPDGRAMWAWLARHRPDLIVLDIMLSGHDGLALCRELRAGRETARIPVLMLTARGEDVDRIVGLEMGADDYLVKPFVPRELLARIRNVLRRVRALPPDFEPEPVRCLVFAGWKLDTATRLLLSPGGVATPLSGGEYRLLTLFLDHPNRVLDRDQIMETLHGREAGPLDRAVDAQVSRLRQRIGDDGKEPQLIKTVRGQGYVLAAVVERRQSCD
jgi:two-component system OmpR family response regulator